MLLSVVLLVGCAKEEEIGSSFLSISSGEVVSMYVDGVNVINERNILEEKLKDNVSAYYGVAESDIHFQMFCMLETEMITVEVEVDEEWYLVTGDGEGDIKYVTCM